MRRKLLNVLASLLVLALVLPFATFGPGNVKPAEALYNPNWSEHYGEDFTSAYSGITELGSITTALIGDTNTVYKTTNSGSTWTSVSNDRAMSMKFHPDTTSTVWMGTWGSGIKRSSDTGSTWSSINGTNTDGDNIWDVEVLDVTGGHIVIASDVTDGAVYCYNGTSWTDILDATNPRGVSVYDGYIYIATDDGLNRASTPTSCSSPTWDTSSNGAWSEAYDIAIYLDAYYVATDAGIFIGDWTSGDWVQEWDIGRVFSLFPSESEAQPSFFAATETAGAIQREDTSQSWVAFGSGLLLDRVNTLVKGNTSGWYVLGETNLDSSHAVWRAAAPTAVELCGFWAVQDGPDMVVYWETCWEQFNLGFDLFYRNMYFNPSDELTYPEWNQINDLLIPGENEPHVYSYTWAYDASGGIGPCQDSNPMVLYDIDAMNGPAEHHNEFDMSYDNIENFWLYSQRGRDVTVKATTGDEFHVKKLIVQYGYGRCGSNVQWVNAANVNTSYPGTSQGGTYSLSFQLPQTSPGMDGYCARITAEDAADNCLGPYSQTGGYYSTLVQLAVP